MSERARNALVGLTTVVALLGFAGMMLAFGSFSNPWGKSYDLTVRLDDAGGLREGSRVTLGGIPIGNVTHVAYGDGPRDIRVTAQVEGDTPIPQGVTAEVRQAVVGGGSTLALMLPADVAPGPALATDGTAQVNGVVISPGDAVVAALDKILREPAQDFHTFVESFAPLADSVTGVLGDEQVQADLRDTLANAGEVIAKLTTTADKLGALADEAPELLETTRVSVRDLAADYRKVAEDLSAVLQRADAVATKIDEGQGAAGRFLNDPALYDNLADAAERLQSAIDEARALIRQLREEGLQVEL
ncbi:MAG: MlaD family protein [Planctomycetota bacterium]